jgi:hypothetical protein
MKLLEILLEVLRESKPITLDKSVFPQMDDVYDNFKKYYKDEYSMNYLKSQDYPPKIPIYLGDIEFINQYDHWNIHRKKNNKDPKLKKISVFLTYDKNSKSRGSYTTDGTSSIRLNINSNVGRDKSTFINTLYHELVHSIDPKLFKSKVRSSLYKNNKNEDETAPDFYIKYLKKPTELDAFSSSFVNQIKDVLGGSYSFNKKRVKYSLRILINDLLGLLKKYPNGNLNMSDYYKIYSDFKKDHLSQIHDIKRLVFNNSDNLINDFLANIIYYLSKPSQFKKYIQRLSTLL